MGGEKEGETGLKKREKGRRNRNEKRESTKISRNMRESENHEKREGNQKAHETRTMEKDPNSPATNPWALLLTYLR